MSPPPESPLTDAALVQAFLRRVPLQVDGERFLRFALGFPRHYLERTPPVEVIRHYGLMEALGKRTVISSLARDRELWQLCVVAADRSFLFATIAGTLSAFGMNIVEAEAFANGSALVLDTFRFADPRGRFADDAERRAFQHRLEETAAGRSALPEPETASSGGALRAVFDDQAHKLFTRLLVEGPDRPGLLYRVALVLSEAGCSIELAEIATPDAGVHDVFHLSAAGGRLRPETQAALLQRLSTL